MFEHKQKLIPGFTPTYKITWLAYYETANDIYSAISREKQIKAWLRVKKGALVETMNPRWQNLSAEWYDSS
jgi:putative endonuclease